MSDSILEIAELSFAYYSHSPRRESIFSGISLQLGWDESLAIIGTSGCGKSTLLKLIFGSLKPQSGKVLYRGQNIVYLCQEETLIPWETTLNNMLLPFRLKKKSIRLEDLKKEALQILSTVGLKEYKNRCACELSGGMRKRLELARSLLQKPDLLLMDEPFATLDLITKEHIVSLCKKLQKQHKFSIILVTHDPEDIFSLSHRTIVLGKSAPHILYTFDTKNTENKKDSFLDIHSPHVQKIKKILSNEFKTSKEQNISILPRSKVRLKSKIPVGILVYGITIPALAFLMFIGKYLARLPDYLIPHPSDILSVFYETLANRNIFPDLFMTMLSSSVGFGIAFLIATPLGYLISHCTIVKRLFLPPAIIFNSLPVIALAPFFLLWIGIGFLTRIFITILVIFFPLLLTSKQAFDTAYSQTLLHRQILLGHPIKYFLYFDLPYALPTLFTGWKVALSGSIMGAVIGDFVVNNKGLGSLISIAKSRFDTPLMFVSLIWLALLGLTYFSIMYIIEHILLVKIRACS